MMVSPSGYANWKARGHGSKPGGKRLSDDHLLTLIRAIHARTKGAYGSPRIYDEHKGTDLSRWNEQELEAVALTLNNRPRKTLSWNTPAEALNDYLQSIAKPGVATTG